MAYSEELAQHYRNAAREMGDGTLGGIFAVTEPVVDIAAFDEALQSDAETVVLDARHEAEIEHDRYEQGVFVRHLNGDSGATPFININARNMDQGGAGGDSKRAKSERSTADHLFLELLSNIERAIAENNVRLAEFHAWAEENYGEDYWNEFAEMYLSPEQMETLEGLSGEARDEAIMDMLIAEMLNPDGSIKTEYQGSEVAEYVASVQRDRSLNGFRDGIVRRVEAGATMEDAIEAEGGQLSPEDEGLLLENTRSEVAPGEAATAQLETSLDDEDLGADAGALSSASTFRI